MRLLISATVALVILTSATLGQSVTMPEQVMIDPNLGLPLTVVIEWDGDDVSFTDKLGDDVMIIRAHSSDPKKIILVVFVARAAKPGTYYLQAASCKDKKMSAFKATKVIVKPGGLPPPGPIDPPNPPKPPADPYQAAVQAAWQTDPTANKEGARALLVELYRKADTLLSRPAVKTAKDLHDTLQAARKTLIDEDLAVTRKALNKALDDITTDPAAVMDEAAKARAKAAFAKMTAALEALR